MKRDPELGQAIWNLPDPHDETCRYLALGKTVDYAILRPKPQDSPRTVSTGRTRLRKLSKYLDLRDTNVAFGWELTEGNF
jgi:hypothetical protein